MYIDKSFLTNQAFQMNMVRFNEQAYIPIVPTPAHTGDVPPGTLVLVDGSLEVTMIAPHAKEVKAESLQNTVYLANRGDGVWRGKLPFTKTGMVPLKFYVDGNEALNPIAPIGFGGDRAVNYAEVPDPADDFLLMRDVPHGSIIREFYYSETTGQYESCLVYTPPYYHTQPQQAYPVLYLQHGGGENENAWVYQGKIHFIMDNLLDAGKTVPMLIVMNNGSVQMPGQDGIKQIDFPALEQLLVRDCMPYIERKYHVREGKDYRGYAGLSRGSLTGAQIVMNHLELFSVCGLFTGFTHPDEWNEENSHLKALDDSEYFNSQLKVFYRAMGADEESIPNFERESRLCDEKGIRCITSNPPGSHEWKTWRRCAYEFLQLIFKEGGRV